MTIYPTTRSQRQNYEAFVEGESEPIVRGARDPEHEVCRVLVARSYDGPVHFYTPEGTLSMRLDARKGAEMTVEDTDKGVPRLREYTPHPGTAIAGGR